MADLDAFFAYAYEREKIRIRREVLKLPRPWTDDPILQKYRFCNVYREDDRTTRWFKDYVRGPLSARPEVLLATVLFRWFNRISTGEAIFCQTGLYHSGMYTAWEEFIRIIREQGEVRTSVLRHAITAYVGERGPFVTGAYMIPSHMVPGKLQKLDGILYLVGKFAETDWSAWAASMIESPTTWSLADTWSALKEEPGLGPFMAYEIVTDLYHTKLLCRAPDALTWANPGPGAKRGLNRIHGRSIRESVTRDQQIEEMQDILAAAQAGFWPPPEFLFDSGGRLVSISVLPWTMREVEHTLCEFDKYERARHGQGRPRGVMR